MPSQSPLDRARLRLAWAVALVVDGVQIAAEATTGPVGWFIGAGLDVVALVLLWRLVGFHWAFLPSFLTEWIPGLNMAPFWSVALGVATRGRTKAPPPASNATS